MANPKNAGDDAKIPGVYGPAGGWKIKLTGAGREKLRTEDEHIILAASTGRLTRPTYLRVTEGGYLYFTDEESANYTDALWLGGTDDPDRAMSTVVAWKYNFLRPAYWEHWDEMQWGCRDLFPAAYQNTSAHEEIR